jgi:hypothetical protein
MSTGPARLGWAGTIALFLGLPFLAGADGNGCNGGKIMPGPARTADGGSCVPADCAGLEASADAKICPGGASVGRSVCSPDARGQCSWQFPACPMVGDAAAPADAAEVCVCTGPAPGAPNIICPDGSTGGPVCEMASDGTCGWQFRECPTSCATDADCASGSVCAFPVADACSAKGTCVVPSPVACNAVSLGCACDGTMINTVCTGLPSGYVSAPLLSNGPCAGAADGGACCPAGWDLYACTFPDGGAGQACHNPQLGCASSLTCGQGCDGVVSGRCAP